ncbi:PEP-CTERM sorting domain-containing protein [Albimonas pacifica]|uniref:PEP-CTERM protein-sorting domain-containing protein n=1 Tax=Albimonas pacifica TaxID=1114924 RepID=A0A1I3HMR2_9RHOB|nr:PEP-CTERM sorting domain-containing protein [Albimonas pacifica]SFI36913.1 PEP-CTERM protein-sorting domain-containing protein [Albimonas pacifica]
MKLASIALGASLALGAQPAMALVVGYTLEIGTNTNLPGFTLTNTSDTAQITGFRFTVGQADGYNFDYVSSFSYSPVASHLATIDVGDTANGGARTDEFVLSFTGFDPLEEFSMVADVDPDSFNDTVNYNTVFWNNAGSVNATMEVTFSTGQVLSQTAPDPVSVTPSYTFSQSSAASAVPIPATLPMLGAGLALGGLLLRRRRG